MIFVDFSCTCPEAWIDLQCLFLTPFVSMLTSWAALPRDSAHYLQANSYENVFVCISLALVYGKFREELWDGYYHRCFSKAILQE